MTYVDSTARGVTGACAAAGGRREAEAAGEAAGRFFADEHELSVICLRIGTVNPQDKPGSVR